MVFLIVVNMDSEYSKHLAFFFIILKLVIKDSGKASVLILALTGCWTRKSSNLCHNTPSEL